MSELPPLLKRALLSPSICGAYNFAFRAHEGQTRHGGESYIEHPQEVAHLLLEHYPTATEDMVVAALLHDVAEDTSHTLEELEKEFGSRIIRILWGLTNPEQESSESRNQYFKRVQARWVFFSWEAKIVKLADCLHNLRSLCRSHWDASQKKRYAEQALEMLEAFDLKEKIKLVDLVRGEALRWTDPGEKEIHG